MKDPLDDQLKSILRRSASATADIAEIRGELGSDVKDFLETTGVHKKALGFCSQLHRMQVEKRNDVLASLRKLLPICEEMWATENTPDLFPEEEVEMTAEEAADEVLGGAMPDIDDEAA